MSSSLHPSVHPVHARARNFAVYEIPSRSNGDRNSPMRASVMRASVMRASAIPRIANEKEPSVCSQDSFMTSSSHSSKVSKTSTGTIKSNKSNKSSSSKYSNGSGMYTRYPPPPSGIFDLDEDKAASVHSHRSSSSKIPPAPAPSVRSHHSHRSSSSKIPPAPAPSVRSHHSHHSVKNVPIDPLDGFVTERRMESPRRPDDNYAEFVCADMARYSPPREHSPREHSPRERKSSTKNPELYISSRNGDNIQTKFVKGTELMIRTSFGTLSLTR